MSLRPPTPTLLPYTTLFRSKPPRRRREKVGKSGDYNEKLDKRIMTEAMISPNSLVIGRKLEVLKRWISREVSILGIQRDRKSTRLNSSHVAISYAVFCVKNR